MNILVNDKKVSMDEKSKGGIHRDSIKAKYALSFLTNISTEKDEREKAKHALSFLNRTAIDKTREQGVIETSKGNLMLGLELEKSEKQRIMHNKRVEDLEQSLIPYKNKDGSMKGPAGRRVTKTRGQQAEERQLTQQQIMEYREADMNTPDKLN